MIKFKELLKEIFQNLEQDAKKYNSAEEFIKSRKLYYHGTEQGDFSEFSNRFMGTTDEGFAGRGYYFTANRKYAEEYGNTIIEAALDLNNPFIIDDTDILTPNYMRKKLGLDEDSTAKDISNKLKTMGYDGVVVNYDYDDEFDGTADEFEVMVFNKSQIKTKKQLIDIWNKVNKKNDD